LFAAVGHWTYLTPCDPPQQRRASDPAAQAAGGPLQRPRPQTLFHAAAGVWHRHRCKSSAL